MRNNKNKGFTLIELLIVIAIIGILAAVLVPNLLGARQRAFDTASLNCGRSIQTAQVAYNGDKFTYADDLNKLDTAFFEQACADVTADGTDGGTAMDGSASVTVSAGASGNLKTSYELAGFGQPQGAATFVVNDKNVTRQ